ncbi:MAG TPA: DUF2911 domain-containing protein [Terriglobales bacterium]|jgi:hypothetical protein|nr:DUF2911 domain-containing protein [Terriglobales bacterium]
MRTVIALVGLVNLLSAAGAAQDVRSTYCNFDEDNQVTIQYNPVVKDPPKNGKVWSPGVTLYVQTPLIVGSSTLALGAYSVHFIPDKKNWTLIVNRNVASPAVYNSSEDVARAPMELGELPAPQKELQLAFAHMGNECSLRAYYQKTGAFAAFTKK